MSRNGSGVYSLAAGNPVTTGTTISSSWANNTLTDIASALTASIASDGQTVITANLPMSTYAHTGVGVATARTMYGTAGQIQDNTLTYLTTIAGTNVITAVAPVLMSAYATGQTFYFIAAGGNTGAVTVNINAIGAKSVKKTDGSALVSGDILTGAAVQIMYDGTNFQLLSDSNGTNETVGNLTVTGTTTATGLITANGGVSGALNGSLGATTPSTVVATTITGSGDVTITKASGSLVIGATASTAANGAYSAYTSNAGTAYVGREGTTPALGGASGDLAIYNNGYGMYLSPSGGLKTLNTIGVGNATPSASGAGITFPNTQSASTDANTLDDYEEGGWTPNQGAALTIVGAFVSSGTYTKIGRVVTVTAYYRPGTTVAVAGNGLAMSTNLPFSAASFSIGTVTNDAQNVTSGCLTANVTILSTGVIAATPNVYWSATYIV